MFGRNKINKLIDDIDRYFDLIDQDKYANGKGGDKGKFNCGVDEDGKPTKKVNEINAKGMEQGIDYQMLALRLQIAF